MHVQCCVCERWTEKNEMESRLELPAGAYAGLFITTTATENRGTVFGTLEFDQLLLETGNSLV